MQTKLSKQLANTAHGKRAEEIIKSCVHCGFCSATCPTYQLLGNELDSPRGRIYLIKSAIEDNQFSRKSLQHLDRCLTCRSCETTCPSGVEYSQLVNIGRELVEEKRAVWQKVMRSSVRKLLTTPALFNLLGSFAKHSSIQTPVLAQEGTKGRVLLLTGCVQPTLTPNTNHVTKNVLAKLGYKVVETAQKECCGAIDHHASAHSQAVNKIKQNIDQWNALLDSGIESIISTASGCGAMVKDYPTFFEIDDPYYQKAVAIVSKTKDIAEFLFDQDLSRLATTKTRISYHAPCSLQHGQKQPQLVEGLLSQLGYELSPITDSHLCCGSAGTYSIFQAEIASQLKENKLKHLTKSQPDLIVTSNVGCQLHLAKGSDTPVQHWIELLDN